MATTRVVNFNARETTYSRLEPLGSPPRTNFTSDFTRVFHAYVVTPPVKLVVIELPSTPSSIRRSESVTGPSNFKSGTH